jgi:streptogramin lyase
LPTAFPRALIVVTALWLALASSAAAKPGDIIVGDSSSGEILRVKPKTGATSVLSDDPRFNSPNDIVFGRDGTIYVADYEAFDGGGGVFRINPRNGNARVVSDDPVFEQPDGIAMAPNGDLFVTDLDITGLVRVRLPSGNANLVSDGPLVDSSPTGVVVPPDGFPIVGSSDGVTRVNPVSGDASLIADGADGLTGCCGIVRDPGGTLYMADSTDGVQSIDPRTGEVSDLSGPVLYDGYGMGFDLRGRVLLTADDQISSVNVRTGAVRSVADDFVYAEGMEVEPPKCGGLTATVVGTTGRDELKGSKFGDVIAGLGAADKIKGRGGRDVICGGAGPDQINGGADRDRCFGQGGRDRERRC